MNVEIIIENIYSKINGIENIELIDDLDSITSYYVEGYQYTKAYREGWFDRKTNRFNKWDGKKHLLNNKMIFPTGLLERIKAYLEFRGISYKIIDNRKQFINFNSLEIHSIVPRPYQIDAVNAAIKHGRGMIRIGTGGGKTAVAAMIIAKYNLPAVVYVIGKDLLYQFQKELSKFLNCEIGIIGDGRCEIKRFNVCSIWTAITSFGLKQNVSTDDEDWSPEIFEIGEDIKKKIKRVVENSVVSVFDEAHFASTDTIQSIYKAGKNCRFMFGMSATPWKDGGGDLLLESICGPRIFNMSASKLIENGYLIQPKITVLNVPKIKEEPSNYHQAYSSYIVNNQVRNEMVISSAKTLIKMGRKVLILIKQIKHGKILTDMLQGIPHYFLNGEIDSETREVVKEAFSDGRLKCLIASNILDMGVDIPILDSLILAGSGKSSVRALQRIGRAVRKHEGKKDALIVDFWDNVKYLEKHSATRIAIYQTESKFIIKFPKDFDHRKIKTSKVINKIKK